MTTPSTVTADIAAELEKIRRRTRWVTSATETALPGANAVDSARDVPRMVAGYEALLKLHGDEPIYVIASDCDHPEPEDDTSEEWEAWEQDHPAGAGGGRVCELTEVERACLECSRLAHLYDDTTWISPAECTVRSAIAAALEGTPES